MSQLALDWASLGCVLVVLFLCVPRSFYLFSSLVLWISVFYISSCCHIDTFASSGPVGVLDLARHFTSFSFFQCLQLHFPVDLTFRLKWSKTLSDSHIVITAFLSPTSTKWVGGLHLWLHIVFTRGILKMVLVPVPPRDPDSHALEQGVWASVFFKSIPLPHPTPCLKHAGSIITWFLVAVPLNRLF